MEARVPRTAITVIPSGVPIGAEIRGVDLSAPVDAPTCKAIRAALDEHSVLAFRGQCISDANQVAFTRLFGTLKPPRPESQWRVPGYPDITRVSNILEDGKPIGLYEAGQYWHSDRCAEAVPNGYALLRAIEIPHDAAGNPLGGTMFASGAYAYDMLPEDMKARIRGLRATFHYQNLFRTDVKAYESKYYDVPPVVHPVVRTHPFTGRKCLYVNEQYAVGIEGMDEGEARQFIEYLCKHIARPEFIYTHRWQEHDLLMWDDCAVQHKAIGDYTPDQRRLLMRTSVEGTVPV